MIMRVLFVLLLIAAFANQSIVARSNRETEDNHTIRIVVTVAMVADIVRAVVGDRAEVVGLIGEGVDPHLYAPTRGDVQQLLSADVIFYVGLLLEGRLSDLLDDISDTKPIFAVTTLIDSSYLYYPDNYGGENPDPHVWMDVSAWGLATKAVAEAMVEVDDDNAMFYRENANRYRLRLNELDEYARSVIATIPEGRRALITAHDAFNYFGRAYDIDVYGIQGISTASEAGLSDLRRIVDLLVERDIASVFVETSVSDKNVRALIEGAQARGHRVEVGGSIFSDAMGTAGTYRGTYIGMIDHNATVIANALGGSAPIRGMNGMLIDKE